MNSELFMSGIFAAGALAISLLLILIPLKVMSILTTPFSMKTFGIRKIRRWHSRTDTLANLMLWISVLFCIAAPLIPYSPIIYLVWIILTWLCTVSRAVRMTAVREKWKKLTVIFLIDLTFLIGTLAAIGAFNHYALWIRSFQFVNDLFDGTGRTAIYYLTNVQPAAYILQTLILIIPLVNLWGQFKYMRLENTFKASNIYTYILKSLLVIVVLFGAAFGGPKALERIYQVDENDRISNESRFHPLDREQLAERMKELEEQQRIEQERQASEQAAQEAQPEVPAEPAPEENPEQPVEEQPQNVEGQPENPEAQPENPEVQPEG